MACCCTRPYEIVRLTPEVRPNRCLLRSKQTTPMWVDRPPGPVHGGTGRSSSSPLGGLVSCVRAKAAGPERMDNAVSLHAAAEGSRRVWVVPPRPHTPSLRRRATCSPVSRQTVPGLRAPPGLASVGTGPSEGPGHRAPPRHERLLPPPPRRAKRDDNLRRSKLERRGRRPDRTVHAEHVHVFFVVV